MRALVYHGPGKKAWEEVPEPEITDDGDAIVRVDAVTICGTDLHILKGDVPEVPHGRILGHEAVGTVEEVGAGVQTPPRPATACWSPASPPAGAAATAVRDATASAWAAAAGSSATRSTARRPSTCGCRSPTPPPIRSPTGSATKTLLMLADILPTGYEVGVLNGGVRPGDVVAVVGAGPIGLSAIIGARLFSPSHIVAIDLADSRLDAAKQFGADVTVNNGREDPLSVDHASSPAGSAPTSPSRPSACPRPSSWRPAWSGPVAGSRTSACTAKPRTLHLEELWIRDVTITTGLVDTYSTPTLLRLITSRPDRRRRFVTHHFDLDEFDEAYDVFARAADTGALKVVLTRGD